MTPRFHFFVGEDGERNLSEQTLNQCDEEGFDTSPHVAHECLEHAGDDLRIERGARLAHDDCGERSGEQPQTVENTGEPGHHAFEQRPRCRCGECHEPIDERGSHADDRGDSDIDHTPFEDRFRFDDRS